MKRLFQLAGKLFMALFFVLAIVHPSVAQATSTLQDGTYTVPFTALHASKNQPSKMNDYFVSPGKLTVKEGKQFVSFKVKSSDLVTAFKVEQNGVLIDAKVVSTNVAENTRIVEFEVADLTVLAKGKVTIKIPIINYHSTYDIRMSFGTPTK